MHRKTATSSSANAVVNQQFLSVGRKVEGDERVKHKTSNWLVAEEFINPAPVWERKENEA